MLILVGSIGILLWITYRFRDFRMGATALVALLHDVLVVVGIFAILGTFAGLQIDSLFVTAMLTVIGFSVHDTIVVFDRVRENRARHVGEPFDRDRQPLDPADARPVDHDQPDRRPHAAGAAAVRRGGDRHVRARAADRDHLRDLLVDLQRGPLLVVWHLRDDKRREAELAARPSRRPAT